VPSNGVGDYVTTRTNASTIDQWTSIPTIQSTVRHDCMNPFYTPFTRSSWLDKLARRAGYILAGRASSMFARRLLDVAQRLLDVC